MGENIRGVARISRGNTIQKKYLIITLFVVILLILFSGGFGIVNFVKEKFSAGKGICGDGTPYYTCSVNQPYYCLGGSLIEGATVCGCPQGFMQKGNSCISKYHSNPKEINLTYVLRGEKGNLSFVVYKGMADYVSGLPRSIIYLEGENSSRADFKLKSIDEELQREFLLPLVVKIQDITDDKTDQMRIAVSIVQNIPFGNSNKSVNFGSNQIDYTRYPYEVLYDMEGVCGEKTELLVFLLKELGYGVSFFYYADENHEAVGVKCPVRYSLEKSGYCFIETTAPSIITDDKINYFDVGKLYSYPEIYLISEGISIENNLYEYGDSSRMQRIRRAIEKNGKINFIRHLIYKHLKEKYGLVSAYYGG